MTRVSRQRWFWLAVLALGLLALYVLREVLAPFVAGAAIAYLLDPVCDRLQRLGMGRTWATTLVTLAFVVLVVLLLLLLVPTLYHQLVSFIESLPFTYLHVFTYSERPGTPAATRDQVPVRVRKDRNQVLREIAAAKNLAFRESMVSRTLSAVTIDDGRIALTGNYLKVELAVPSPPNRLIDVRIGKGVAEGLGGVGEGAGAVRELAGAVVEVEVGHLTRTRAIEQPPGASADFGAGALEIVAGGLERDDHRIQPASVTDDDVLGRADHLAGVGDGGFELFHGGIDAV